MYEEENAKRVDAEVMSEKKLKYLKFKAWLREKVRAGVDWCKDHKEEAILIATGTAVAVDKISKASNTRRVEEKRLEYYDPHTGAHWQLRRRLNNAERAELMRRQRNGEYTEDILDDMRVLRK